MTRFAPTVLVLTLACAGVLGQTQQIYRCGPDGRELSQRPCGVGPAVVPAAGPSSAEQAAAKARVRREAELADRMERDRLARERAQAKANAHAVTVGPVRAPAASAPHAKPAKKPKAKRNAPAVVKPQAATPKAP
jgi:hypothetical protein